MLGPSRESPAALRVTRNANLVRKAVFTVQPDSRDSAQRKLRSVQVRFASLGFEFGSGIAGFVLLGWWFDRSFQTAPAGIITAAVLGCVGGLYVLIRRSYEIQRELGDGTITQRPPTKIEQASGAEDREHSEERLTGGGDAAGNREDSDKGDRGDERGG